MFFLFFDFVFPKLQRYNLTFFQLISVWHRTIACPSCSSDSSPNNRGENARIKKNRPRQSNPISRSDTTDEADELSAVIYSVSRFFSPARYISTFDSMVSNLRKFRKLSLLQLLHQSVPLRNRIIQANPFRLTTGLLFPHDGYQNRDRWDTLALE